MPDWKFTPGSDFAALNRALRPVVEDVAGRIAKDAADTAPRLTGRLAESVYVRMHDGLVGEVGFTDSKAVGAHEEMHDNYDAGKRPKFLELALHEHADDLVSRAVAAAKGALR